MIAQVAVSENPGLPISHEFFKCETRVSSRSGDAPDDLFLGDVGGSQLDRRRPAARHIDVARGYELDNGLVAAARDIDAESLGLIEGADDDVVEMRAEFRRCAGRVG